MERNREARRGTVAAVNGGLSRRRQRSSSLRDSPEEDGGMEMADTTRLRDRGGKKDRDRDRSSRNKRRRGERMLHGSNRDEGDDSSEESVDEEEEEEEEDDVSVAIRLPPPAPPPPNLVSSSSSLPQSNHHHHQQQQQQQQLQSSVNTALGNVSGCNLRSENGPVSSTATPTSSDVTSVSASGGMFGQHDHLGFLSTDFHSPVSGSAQGGGIMGNRSQPRITIMR